MGLIEKYGTNRERAALQDFPPLPTPGEDDWLYDRSAKGQTFQSFVQNQSHRKPKAAAKKIYLLPIVERVG
eukprot:SAG31_NODE_23789_length_495_cov_1.421717_1_plen_70_part_10